MMVKRSPDGKVGTSPKEHFGYTDALGDPVFDGQYPTGRAGARGRATASSMAPASGGRLRPASSCSAIPTKRRRSRAPPCRSRSAATARSWRTASCTRMSHASVNSSTETAARFGAVFGISNPTDAVETLKAKIAGRWSDGVPSHSRRTSRHGGSSTTKYPDVWPDLDLQGYLKRRAVVIDFKYKDDPEGYRLPAHLAHASRQYPRRARADPDRRLGAQQPSAHPAARAALRQLFDSPTRREHGIIMLVVCAEPVPPIRVRAAAVDQLRARLERRQRYRPAGRQPCDRRPGPKAKFVIASDPKTGRPPFVVEGLPQFVETRGGEYFFVPSMTALRMIGMGTIDPT